MATPEADPFYRSEYRQPARIFLGRAAVEVLADERASDIRLLLDQSEIAVATGVAVLEALQRATGERRRLERLDRMYPTGDEHRNAEALMNEYRLGARAAIDLACALRLRSDGFVFVEWDDFSWRIAKKLGINVYVRPREYPRKPPEYPGGLRQLLRDQSWLEKTRTRARQKAAEHSNQG